ncbi:hypothetical protein MLD38_017446 [Melastoma candidum]|uniref:Uncharacterized protein n=1 Tax=Melastoma candidum TaxID=119954 RepID=A0ACB9QYW4_9MYRT|nr:hypothetical protein MLD38_017446 [Melastoma candidum]
MGGCKLRVAAGSPVGASLDPGETTWEPAFERNLERMKRTPPRQSESFLLFLSDYFLAYLLLRIEKEVGIIKSLSPVSSDATILGTDPHHRARCPTRIESETNSFSIMFYGKLVDLCRGAQDNASNSTLDSFFY